ncbi:Hypothetical predicted protein [Lecanosticta acicola]|uniref:SprT-like domain-containing protein n=1 Tax=Lecanosticta acicola TaxID=111012 RepID=A0AAI9E851_9PEZI|nr:Hypothetical predicted protein [Lecanosticta acicola]
MARLRRASGDGGDSLPRRTQQRKPAEPAETTRPKTARRRQPARYIISDDSSAEESEAPAKFVQKTKSVSTATKTQVRLGPPKSLSQSSLAASKEALATSTTEFALEEKPARKPRRAILSPVKQKQPRLPSPPPNPEPELSDNEGEVDIEESIWCGTIDDSSSSSGEDLLSPRQLFGFPRKVSQDAKKALSPAKQPDLTKRLQALSIFDDEPVLSKRSRTDLEESRPESRPGTSSDKENDMGIIRFSPPRLKSPQKKAPIERPATPPHPPPSPSKLKSPSKRPPRIPTPPLRPSLDAFWTAEAINDWNDQYSPQKPLKSPRKLNLNPNPEDVSPSTSPRKTSPTKRTKAEIEARKNFDIRKITLAESFLTELDQTVAQGQIQALAASTGGVRIIWSKTLNSTAGRANWRRETAKVTNQSSQQTVTTHKHFASIELASKVIDDEHRLLNVIAHEFCHLCNFMISGIKDQPHGKQFKIWGAACTRAFGEKGVEVTTKHSYEIEYKYIWKCVDQGLCGMEFKRHSKSIDPVKHRCGGCKSKLVQIKPVPRKVAGGERSAAGTSVIGGKGGMPAVAGYTAFVKAHFAAVKKSLPGASHKEVMEALGKKYRAEKAGGAGGKETDGVDGIAKDLEAVDLQDREVIELD